MKVGVIIPEDSRNIRTATQLSPRDCYAQVNLSPAEFGQTFERATLSQLQTVFEQVTRIESKGDATKFDLVIEARLNRVGYYTVCKVGETSYFTVDGSISGFDSAGREVWRGSIGSKRLDPPPMVGPSTPQKGGKHYGEIFSDAIGQLVQTWAKDLVQAPILASARKTGGSAGGTEMAYWDAIKNSTNPADYRAYLEAFPRGQFAPLARARSGEAVAS